MDKGDTACGQSFIVFTEATIEAKPNVCWYAHRVVEVKKKYGLTWDQQEALRAKEILDSCISTSLRIPIVESDVASEQISDPESGGHPLELYDDNGNGRITCAEARAHGIAPVRDTHPAYKYMRDANNNGVVCE